MGIARLGLVQAAMGAVVVLATSTLNRVMVVEWSLPAIVPGVLVALHYAIQVLRPRMGHGSDMGGRRTPWIVGGMVALCVGGTGAAAATALMGTHPALGVAAAVLAYSLIGAGVGAAGTSLLVLLGNLVAPARRPAAATVVWIMMIAGFGITAGAAGASLDPFGPARLIAVTATVCGVALLLAVLAVWGVERHAAPPVHATGGVAGQATARPAGSGRFLTALAEVWAEPQARRFAVFVFGSMLAYSAQELVLEPFAGAVFHYTPGESTSLTGLQHAGALLGMLAVALLGSIPATAKIFSLRRWTIGGCLGSGASLLVLALVGLGVLALPLRPCVFALGATNGAFAVAAIGSMMSLMHTGQSGRAGVRMGLWGAAQAVAFAAGGLLATAGSDLFRAALGSAPAGYAAVFVGEAALFLLAASQARGVYRDRPAARRDTAARAPGAAIPEAS
jgi:BCD family chlorophyll transporter-like MFS transporter